LYFLGKSLELVGQRGEALEVYHRVHQVNPAFRNVADVLNELRQDMEQRSQEKESDLPNTSRLRGTISKVFGFFTDHQK
jgi:hypothetical protein